MMRSSSLLALVMLAASAAAAAGCEASASVRAIGQSAPSDAGADDDSPAASNDGASSKDASASDAATKDGGDAGDASACGDTSNDPKNCGGCGHDCLGTSCVAGVCSPELVAEVGFTDLLGVSGQDLVVVAATRSDSRYRMYRGSTTPGAAVTEVPGPTIDTSDLRPVVRIGGGYAYYSRGTEAGLRRRPLTGTTDMIEESVRPIGMSGYGKDVEEYDLDDTNVVLQTAEATYVMTHDGAPRQIPSDAADPARKVHFERVLLKGSSAFGFYYGKLYELPLDGGASHLVGTMATAGWTSEVGLTPSAFVGMFYQYGGSSVSCQTTTVSVELTPRDGSASSTVTTGTAQWALLHVDDLGFTYGVVPCNSGVRDMYSQREGRAGAPVLIARLQDHEAPSVQSGPYVYFTRLDSGSPPTEHVYRVAR